MRRRLAGWLAYARTTDIRKTLFLDRTAHSTQTAAAAAASADEDDDTDALPSSILSFLMSSTPTVDKSSISIINMVIDWTIQERIMYV